MVRPAEGWDSRHRTGQHRHYGATTRARGFCSHHDGELPIAFLTFVTDIGTGTYLIRVEKADREICDSAWTMRIIQGTGIAAAIMILTPWVADYFRDDRLLILLYWLSAVP